MRAMKSTPRNVRHTAPSPPRMLVPPTTMPARTVKARVSPEEAWALSTREASMTPASPAAPPLTTKGSPRMASPPPTPPRGAPPAHPPQPGRLGVAPRRVHVAPGRRAREQHSDHHHGDHGDPDRGLDPEDLGPREVAELLVLEEDDEVAVRDQGGQAGDHERHGQRGDQRVDAQPRDDEAVDEPDGEPDAHAQHDRERRRRARGELRAGHAGQGVDGAHGQVDPAGDEDERPRGRDDQRGRLLVEDVEQVDLGQERRARDRQGDEERGEGQRDAGRAQALGGAPGIERPASGHAGGGAHAAKAAPSTADSVMSSPASSPTMRPARMTSTRWASPRTSSSSEEMSRTPSPSSASDASRS